MKIITAPAHTAVLSNIESTSSFKIKATARSFQILSSSLYANKIRAVIRELSTNAYDSHVDAGNTETPFDVHLPNSLEPWFSIRDYGTGLSHDEVTRIYTTYFESTKTEDNLSSGCLGLGSKSPFAITDNFSVTAIKNGIKGVYSAYINDQGVPSIALMTTDTTDEHSGVEIKFAVITDFYKFKEEASTVYTYFKTKPVISGVDNFEIHTPTYLSRDIIEGVHQMSHSRYSIAVMGNIAYPIDIPNAHEVLGDLSNLLRFNLEMHFEIGELDFQVSREGLSYIPETIAAIKERLEKVNDQLVIKLAEEADKIDNLWDKTFFLHARAHNYLWSSATYKYMIDTNYKYPNNHMSITVTTEKLAEFNIHIKAFCKSSTQATYNINMNRGYDHDKQAYVDAWKFYVNQQPYFVINDTKLGAEERSKYHFKNHSELQHLTHMNVYVMSVLDKTKPMLIDEFLAFLDSPPRVLKASEMLKRERKVATKTDASIFKLSPTNVWKQAGRASDYSSTETYYYLRLSGFTVSFENADMSMNHVRQALIFSFTRLGYIDIHGVRKNDLEWVSKQSNWIDLEKHILDTLNALTQDYIDHCLKRTAPWLLVVKDLSNLDISDDSPLKAWVDSYSGVTHVSYDAADISYLINLYKLNLNVDSYAVLMQEYQAMKERYPLAFICKNEGDAIAEYIKAIDLMKGV